MLTATFRETLFHMAFLAVIVFSTVYYAAAYTDRLEQNLHLVYNEQMKIPDRFKVWDLEQDFGAVGDGKTINTASFERAIRAAKLYNIKNAGSLDKLGVELVVGQPGEHRTFLTGPFNLTSHFTLTVSATNSIVASPDTSLWPVIEPLPSYGQGRDHQGPRHCPFIGGFNLTDITVRGPGIVDGNGASWWKRHKEGPEKYTRGRLFETLYTDGILIEDITLRNSPFWTIHPTYSSNVVARMLTIENPSDSPNTDGFDPDSSINVTLIDSYFSVGDDGVAIKSGWDCFGLEVAMPCKNILIRNLTVNSPCCAGICIGSEMSGGVENVRIEDIRLKTVGQGLRIKANLGRGGYVRNISYLDVVVDNAINVVIQANDHYGSRNPSCGSRNATAVPLLGNLLYHNITALGGDGIGVDFTGLSGYGRNGVIQNVQLDRVDLSRTKGFPSWHCAQVEGHANRKNVFPLPVCKALA